ncbi:MAG: hypothetical protein LBJ11_01990 [Oscillospiraceae bacterium]|nr:hypothetical protein [Oscillospiraceae bacterium]
MKRGWRKVLWILPAAVVVAVLAGIAGAQYRSAHTLPPNLFFGTAREETARGSAQALSFLWGEKTLKGPPPENWEYGARQTLFVRPGETLWFSLRETPGNPGTVEYVKYYRYSDREAYDPEVSPFLKGDPDRSRAAAPSEPGTYLCAVRIARKKNWAEYGLMLVVEAGERRSGAADTGESGGESDAPQRAPAGE